MSPHRVAALLAGILVAAAAGACASNAKSQADPAKASARPKDTGPYVSDFKLPGRRVYVEFRQAGSPIVMALVNRGSTDPTKVYSEARPNASLKVATDAYMADLCENFRILGFHEMAEGVPPANDAWSIMVEVDNRVQTLYHVRGRASEDVARRAQIQRVFLAVFNQTAALQTIENPDGEKLFMKEQDRVNAELQRKKSSSKTP